MIVMTWLRRILHEWDHRAQRFLGIGLGIALFVPGSVQARPVHQGPSMTMIRRIMARTVEVHDHRTHFVPLSRPLTIRDGRDIGTLTAVIGLRSPTADGHGQLVFFWAGKHFVGWDSRFESASVLKVRSPGPGAFVITYAHYAPGDPLCCPSLKPVRVESGWSGTMFISNGIPPKGPGSGVKVVLRR